MTTTSSWDDFYAELRQEAADAGAEHELEAWEQYFRNELALIRMREAAGLTQRELAARARVPQADISRIEQGKGNPTLRTLVRLAAACGARLRIELPPDGHGNRTSRVARPTPLRPVKSAATRTVADDPPNRPAVPPRRAIGEVAEGLIADAGRAADMGDGKGAIVDQAPDRADADTQQSSGLHRPAPPDLMRLGNRGVDLADVLERNLQPGPDPSGQAGDESPGSGRSPRSERPGRWG
jgi:transcriptional regulator with XRE-family HTH domain